MGPFSGWIGDRYGRRPLVLASCLLLTVCQIGLIFSRDILSFCILRFFVGAFCLVRWLSNDFTINVLHYFCSLGHAVRVGRSSHGMDFPRAALIGRALGSAAFFFRTLISFFTGLALPELASFADSADSVQLELRFVALVS